MFFFAGSCHLVLATRPFFFGTFLPGKPSTTVKVTEMKNGKFEGTRGRPMLSVVPCPVKLRRGAVAIPIDFQPANFLHIRAGM